MLFVFAVNCSMMLLYSAVCEKSRASCAFSRNTFPAKIGTETNINFIKLKLLVKNKQF